MNPRLEKLLKLPRYQRIAICVVLLGLIAGGFHYFLYMPKQQELNNLEKKSQALQRDLQEDRKIAKNLNRYRNEYQAMQSELKMALKELPLKKEIPSLLTTVSSLAKNNGLDVLKFKPGKETPQGFYASVPVTLTIVGNYHELGQFFASVGNLSRIVNVNNLKIDKPKVSDNKTLLTVDFLATTYRFLDESEISKDIGPRQNSKRKKRG
ncbi:MAG: type 4a pilus biogenesis protein PilO [Deltaproteobacteria bacterium]|nr:type 4a pilus biogenesis protein PilO [Deltaproteobacteria bacterium]